MIDLIARVHAIADIWRQAAHLANAAIVARYAPARAVRLVVTASESPRSCWFETARGARIDGRDAIDSFHDLECAPGDAFDRLWNPRQRGGACEYVLELRQDWAARIESLLAESGIDATSLQARSLAA